jgi:drug/metabolite transporter (DMT)-like permease
MLLGGLAMLVMVPVLEGPIVIKHMTPFILLVCGVVLTELIICNNLYAWLLERHSETFLSFTTFTIPIFGAIYSALFLRETITWHFFLSGFILAGAIWLFYSAEHEEKNI